MSAKSGFQTFPLAAQIPSAPDTTPDHRDRHDFPRAVSATDAFELLERPGFEVPILVPPSSFKSPRVIASPRNFSDTSCVTGNATDIMDPISRIDGGHEVIGLVCGDDDEIRPLMDSSSAEGNSVVEVRMDAGPQQAAKMSIFSVSYETARSKERRDKRTDTDLAPLGEFLLWVWGGSRYSGVVCMALSSLVYSIMGLLVDLLAGSLCSFLGIFLIFRPFLLFEVQGRESTVSTGLSFPGGTYYIHAILVALLSAASGGANYCFIRAAAKASEQPLISVFAFVIFACPVAAICMFSFQKFVVPEFFAFIGMITIGVLAFLAEVLLARGLQLEKTCKATSILYIEAFASYILGIMFLGHTPSIAGIFGGILTVTSTIIIVCYGNDKVPGS